MIKKVLITGQDGTHFAEYLLKKGRMSPKTATLFSQ